MWKYSWIILLIPVLAFSFIQKERVERRISKSFAIQSDGIMEIDNRYGNIDIAVGEAGTIKMEVIMAATSNSEKKAQDALERISIDFNEGNNRISARTQINDASGWMSWFSTGNVDMDIHYKVLVPADVFLELTNKYGSIYVETTDRELTVDLSYGQLSLGDINADLDLEMAYSDARISQIKNGDLTLAYSDMEMEDGSDISIEMKYTDLKAGTFQKLRLVSAYGSFENNGVHQMDYNGKYDDLIVGQLGSFSGDASYTDIVIGQLDGEGRFDMRYGDLEINAIRPGFSRIDIHSSYTGVALDFISGASFSLDAAVNYCDIRYDDLKVSENIDKGSSHILKGTRGSGNGQVYARMNYGELLID